MHYVIGDVHGCFRTLEALLERISFDPSRDRIWFTGDLVNRGPSSLEVLRWAVDHDGVVDSVIGNHDLHLLARKLGARPPHRLDTLDAVLSAPDADDLLEWLRNRPLLLEQPLQDGEVAVLVHAGLHPKWDVAAARSIARELETVLRGNTYADLISHYYGAGTETWSLDLAGQASQRAALRVLTAVRRCTPTGTHCPDPARDDEPAGCNPWFQQRPRTTGLQIVFGHWARLGLHQEPGYLALDSGCVWGGSLTAATLGGPPGALWQQALIEDTGLSVVE